MTVERMNRYFPMSRGAGIGGDARFQEAGWYVCDAQNVDSTNLARPIHDEPCVDQDEARGIARMMNETENGYR